jgi:hypothetical protein
MVSAQSRNTIVTEDKIQCHCSIEIELEPGIITGLVLVGRGKFALFNYSLIYFCIVVYSGGGLTKPVRWGEVEERLLTGTLSSQIYNTF